MVNLDQDPTLQAIVPLVVACLIRFHRVRLSLQCPRELTYDRGVACLRGELTEREGRVQEEPAVVAGIRLCERGRALAEEEVVTLPVGNLQARDDLL